MRRRTHLLLVAGGSECNVKLTASFTARHSDSERGDLSITAEVAPRICLTCHRGAAECKLPIDRVATGFFQPPRRLAFGRRVSP